MTPLGSFMERLVKSAARDWNTDGPAFTLILGAGASRSAGVPVAAEMVSILTTLAELKAIKIPRKPARESQFSWTFRHVTERMPWEDEFFNYPRQFLMNCIKRAHREPNLTHLVAAHLSSAHIIGDIVTTNFDDLALAAFWALPAVTAYVEPYVVYHPKTEPPPRSAGGVPVIIKAHGHHTLYGLDVIDRDIATTAPFVKKLLMLRPEPEIGYIVVGYSGGWADGVMAALSDRKITRGKTIYWFYTRQVPAGPHVERVKAASDVRFIRIADADQLFLEMWNELHVERSELRVDRNEVHAVPRPSSMPILEEYHLFNSSRDFPIRRSLPDSFREWWGIDGELAEQDEPDPRLVKLRKDLLPLLDAIDRWDNDVLLFDCAPASIQDNLRRARKPISWVEPPELRQLGEQLPANIEWTRRNRKLLRLALTTKGATAYTLIPALLAWG